MKKRKSLQPEADKIIRVDPAQPDDAVVDRAAGVIDRSGLVVVPTRGLYGLAVDATDNAAVKRIYAVKGRQTTQPILVLIPNRAYLDRLVAGIPSKANTIMDRFWPGGVTLVFAAAASVSSDLTAGSGKIGIRLPAHPVASALTAALDRPITGTSANRSGGPGCARIADLDPAIRSDADLILDAGDLQGGVGSTVVDVACDPPQILREGAVSSEQIFGLF